MEKVILNNTQTQPKSQKGVVDKFESTHTKNDFFRQDVINKVKRQIINWGNIFAMYVLDKE